MAGFKTGSDESQPLSEINITPFVDVMLVLLIIFMVAAPLMESGIAVKLPKTASKSLPSSKEEPLVITLQKNEKIFVGKKDVRKDQLVTFLIKNNQNKKTDEILVRADSDLPYGSVAEVMAMIKNAGIHKIGLVTELEASKTKN